MQIHKFPTPIQSLIIDEIGAVMKRAENGKGVPGLKSLECHCLFSHRYLLPCKHIYGDTKLLTAVAWKNFKQCFEESGLEVYEHYEIVVVEEPNLTEAERDADNRRLAVNEFMARVRDRYWKIEERGNIEQTNFFVNRLEASLNDILNVQ